MNAKEQLELTAGISFLLVFLGWYVFRVWRSPHAARRFACVGTSAAGVFVGLSLVWVIVWFFLRNEMTDGAWWFGEIGVVLASLLSGFSFMRSATASFRREEAFWTGPSLGAFVAGFRLSLLAVLGLLAAAVLVCGFVWIADHTPITRWILSS